MTDNEIIKAVAELAEYHNCFNFDAGDVWGFEKGKMYSTRVPDYLNSRDAIVSVIKKQVYDTQRKICAELTKSINSQTWTTADILIVLTSTPRQLCIATVQATGKWKD